MVLHIAECGTFKVNRPDLLTAILKTKKKLVYRTNQT
jgi:hypothetical protein